MMSDGDDIRGDHVGRTSLLGLLIPHAPRLDQIADMATMIADFGIVAHYWLGFGCDFGFLLAEERETGFDGGNSSIGLESSCPRACVSSTLSIRRYENHSHCA